MHRFKNQKGMAVVAAAAILLMVVPMVGLAIDVSILFIAKTRLQGAVDGAALVGARSLARGVNGSAQIASAQNAATAYVKTNFPSGYFFSYNLQIPTPTVDLSVAFQRSVSVTANVQVPALFERILGFTSNTVAAAALATRRDVNIIIAMDRSGSLQASGSCAALKQAAVNFVNQFANGRDNVGLLTFATSSWVDFPLSNNFLPATANPDIITKINNVACAGSTSSAQALWQAYDQLVNLNQAGALNIILFFTDGQPTGVTVDMVMNTPPCTQTTTVGVDKILRGHFGVFTNYSANFGLLNWSIGPSPEPNGDLVPTPKNANCAFMNGWSNNGSVNGMTTLSDFKYLPATDIFGNSLDSGWLPVTYANGGINPNSTTNMQNLTQNAADNAAARIRAGANDPTYGRGLTGITIYSIGLGNAAIPASPVFLERVSNDPASPIYDATKPAGMYVYAANTADLNTAFQRIASEVLRLAR